MRRDLTAVLGTAGLQDRAAGAGAVMKLVESKDGRVTVIELDPTKWHWVIVSRGFDHTKLRRRDGLIIIKEPDESIEIIEGAERIQLPAREPR